MLSLVVIAAHFWFNTVDWTGNHSGIDLAQYRPMAAAAPNIRASGLAPFAYRVLPPWLAGVAGKGLGDELMGFRLVSALAVLFASLTLYVYLVQKQVRAPTALLMSCLAIISQHVLGGVIFNPFQTCDALCIGLMLVALICIERGSVVGFVIATVAGAVTREPCMLMLPVAIVFYAAKLRSEQADKAEGVRQVLIWTLSCVPAAVVAIGVRGLIEPVNPEWSLGAMLVENSYKFTSPSTYARLLVFAAAPLSLLPWFFFRQTRAVIATNIHLLALLLLVVASSFLGADTERLVAPAMVVYYLIASRILDTRPSTTLTFVIVFAALLSSMNPIYARYTLFMEDGQFGEHAVLAYYIVTALMSVLVLVACLMIARTTSRTAHR